MKPFIISCAVLGGVMFASGDAGQAPLAEAKLIIEHNATDEDTGFQGFLDGEGWKTLTISGPGGAVVRFEALGGLAPLALTELFFETTEPLNAEMPLAAILAVLPEGDYRFNGTTIDGGTTAGVAVLTHHIPAGPVLTAPADNAVVPAGPLAVAWQPVTETIAGGPAAIVAYQLVIEKAEAPHPKMIGKFGLSMVLPSEVTRIEVPAGFLEPGSEYEWEVLAIEESGNQTLSSASFRTQ